MTGVLIRGLRKPTSYQPQSSIMAKIRWGSEAFLVGVEKAVAAASMSARRCREQTSATWLQLNKGAAQRESKARHKIAELEAGSDLSFPVMNRRCY